LGRGKVGIAGQTEKKQVDDADYEGTLPQVNWSGLALLFNCLTTWILQEKGGVYQKGNVRKRWVEILEGRVTHEGEEKCRNGEDKDRIGPDITSLG